MTTRDHATAAAQLERILYILPAAARPRGARISDLARALDVDRQTILDDIEAVAAREYYAPPGTVTPFTISTTGRTVRVHPPVEFVHPVRLNRREALALTLGLRALAADVGPERRTEILAFARRLEKELTAPDEGVLRQPRAFRQEDIRVEESSAVYSPEFLDDDVEYVDLALGLDDDGFRGVVVDAIEQQRCCSFDYLKPDDRGPGHRRIAPYRLIYASGLWYVAAYDMERQALRFFRMDRMLNVALDAERAPPEPPGLAGLLASGAPYSASDDVEVRVRYSPRIARWIVERDGSAERAEDGSVVVRHRVADPGWLVRHVLQYGGEAVVEEPPEARRWVGTAAREVLATSGT